MLSGEGNAPRPPCPQILKTSQIRFSLVSYRFWPVKFITLKTGAYEPILALYFSKKVIA